MGYSLSVKFRSNQALVKMKIKSSYRDKSGEPFVYYECEKQKVQQINSLGLLVDKQGIQTSSMGMLLVI